MTTWPALLGASLWAISAIGSFGSIDIDLALIGLSDLTAEWIKRVAFLDLWIKRV